MKMRNPAAALFLFGLLSSAPAWADYEAGVNASQRNDFGIAFKEFKQAAEAGDTRAYLQLGIYYQRGLGTSANPAEGFVWLKKSADAGIVGGINRVAAAYLEGIGVERNYPLAKQWATKSAAAENPAGQFMLFVAILRSDLNYIEDGKPNRAKYDALAKRPASQRKDDVTAFEMLYKSASRNYPAAAAALAGFYADNVGEGNRGKFLAMLPKFDPKPPLLEQVGKILQEMERLGNSNTTYRIALEARLAAITAATAKAGLADPAKRGECDPQNARLVKMAVTKPISGAEYLPLTIPELAKAYLLKGNWEEEWTYDFCGKQVPVTVAFQADGLGGAYYQAKSK